MLTILIFRIGEEKQHPHIIRVQNDLFSGIKQSGSCEFHETEAIICHFVVMLINILGMKKIGDVSGWLYSEDHLMPI